jgi:hypothetical protein
MNTDKKSIVSVEFQDGFVNDSILLRINENEVLKKNNVSTDLRIALADNSFRTRLPNGEINLDILVPSKNLKYSKTIEIEYDTYIGVSIANSNTPNADIQVTIQKDPFFYL